MTARVRPLHASIPVAGYSRMRIDETIRAARDDGIGHGYQRGYVDGWRWGAVCGTVLGLLLGCGAVVLALHLGLHIGGGTP